MWFPNISLLLAASALAQSNSSQSGLGPDQNGKYEISAEGIRGLFIPYGASVTNLWVKGKDGVERDIVMGFDDAATYEGPIGGHPHLGGIPGPYVNRVKNGTFSLDGVEYHLLTNDGNNTLHGGPEGWDYRNFTIVSHTNDTIVFSLTDPAGTGGWPGEVVAYVTYSMKPYTWSMRVSAVSTTQRTPIMPASHAYWNLDAFANPDTPTIKNHTLSLPFSGQRIEMEGDLTATGTILPVYRNSINDFWSSPKQVGANWTAPDLNGNCGTNCTGYDRLFLVNRAQNGPYNWQDDPVATFSSDWSGIKMDIYSDRDGFLFYSCGKQNGTLPIKSTQGLAGRAPYVQETGCAVFMLNDWIDGINQPEWQREKKQIYGPGDEPFTLGADFVFSTFS